MRLLPAARFDLETLISVAQPHSILLIGDDLSQVSYDYAQQQAALGVNVVVDHLPASDWKSAKSQNTLYDLAIVCGVLETLNKAEGRQLMASLRDQLSRQYCVHLAIDNSSASLNGATHWELSDLLSMALVRVNQYDDDDINYALFKYSIASYKRTPDWLNPDNWANPDLWGKYWW